MIETALQSMAGHTLDDSNHQLQMTLDDDFPNPKRLTWKIDDEIRQMIDEAKINLDRYSIPMFPFILCVSQQLPIGCALATLNGRRWDTKRMKVLRSYY